METPSSQPRRSVLVFSAFYTPFVSGAERFVVEVLERLHAEYEYVMVTSWLDRKLPREEILNGARIRRVGIGHPVDKYLYIFLAPIAAWRMRVDLVHAVMESYAGIALVIYRAFNRTTPTLLTLQSGSIDAPRVTDKVPAFILRAIHAVPYAIHAISTALGDRARRLGATRITVIPNGVDVALFEAARGAVKRPQSIMTIGRLHVDKGFDILIRAMALVHVTHPEARLDIGGGGDEKQHLEALIQESHLQDVVHLLGAVPYAEVPRRMAEAEMFVCPSRAEGMGNVFVEAQAAGTAVIGSRTGGIPDIIEDGVTGLTVPVEDPAATAAAICRLLDHPEERDRMIVKASERLARYDWDLIAKQIGELYEDIFAQYGR